jgi:pyruvate/2-oxoglutarate dehydrogenase complex dihydrolipoamide dehydrogenase (E3) component
VKNWSIIMIIEHFQNLVIGSGVAGKLLGWILASQGQKTVVVERSMVGGSCPNVACLPSKNVIYSAKAVSLVHQDQGPGRRNRVRASRHGRRGAAQTAHLGKFADGPLLRTWCC